MILFHYLDKKTVILKLSDLPKNLQGIMEEPGFLRESIRLQSCFYFFPSIPQM